MTTPLEYLQPSVDSFWEWTDGGRVVSWKNDGKTIAFRKQIVFLIGRLEILPPFETILLVLAAQRGLWPGRRVIVQTCFDAVLGEQTPYESTRKMLSGLDKLHDVFSELDNPKVKDFLTTSLFTTGSRFVSDTATAELVRHVLERGPFPEEIATPAPSPAETERTQKRLTSAVAALLKIIGTSPSREGLLLRARTGFDALPDPAPIAPPTALTVRSLIAEIAEDGELATLAALSHNVLAATYIPRKPSQQDEVPTGGFSDLTNRGTPDHLLPSELAHDDMTLATRIVLNEALYFRRETALSLPGSWRLILLDTGIRLWGTSRVFATAVTLALAASTAARTALSVFCCSDGLVLGDISSRDGLVRLLGMLDSGTHPGPTLEAFFSACDEKGSDAEIFIVTAENSYRDADFRSALWTTLRGTVHVATVTSSGTYRLRTESRLGTRVLTEAKFSLSKILDNPAR